MVRILKKTLLITIKAYQRTLSPDTGIMRVFYPFGVCKYHPTCSEYGYQAISRYGLIKGGFLTIKRVCRCHPFTGGGHDPVPKN